MELVEAQYYSLNSNEGQLSLSDLLRFSLCAKGRKPRMSLVWPYLIVDRTIKGMKR